MKTRIPSRKNFLSGMFSFFLLAQASLSVAQNVTISATPDSGCVPLIVQFNDSVQSGTVINSWLWDFGFFGQTSTLEDPMFGYFASGVYNITLITVDTAGTIDTAYTTVTVFDSPTISLAGFDATCNGFCDGLINSTILGGQPPYNYLWSTAESVEDISGLCPGFYSVTVVDSNGCSVIDSTIISQPTALTASIITTSLIICFGDVGTLTANVTGGVNPYTYLWSNGATTPSINGLTAGTYFVTVVDGNNCTANAQATLTQNPPLTVSLAANDVSCFGSSDGIAWVDSISGGAGGYNYTWSSGFAFSPDTVTGLSPGLVSITVTDANGCVATDSILISEPQPISIQSIVTDIDSCLGTPGSIDITVSMALLPVNYSWSTGEITEDILVTVPGNYSITVTDFRGCTASASNNVNVISGFSLTPVFSNVSCFGLFDGTASVSVNGGVQPFTYQWSNGSTVQVLTNISAGNYSVTVTDSVGCSASESILITEPTEIVITVNAADLVCPGESTANIGVMATGGVPSYIYAWSDGSIGETLTGLPAGSYSLIVFDSNSCMATETVTVATDSTCVWPGDANSDGIANNLDILSIGIAHGFTDFARPNATLMWDAQLCPDWSQNFANGINYKHADCNGDSIILNDDTLAISLNYGLTHAKFPGQNCVNEPRLYVDLPDTLYPGDTVAAPILFGTASLPVTDLYGVAFSIGYDNNIIDTHSVKITYDDVWLNFQDSSILGFAKDFYFNGNTDVAMTRTDHVNLAQRHGRIGILHFTIKDDVSGKNATTVTLEIFINNTTAIDSAENLLFVCGDADSAIVVIEPNGLKQLNESFQAKIFPNPANEKLFVKTEKPMQHITLYSVHGKMLLEENPTQNFFEMNIQELPAGSYVLVLSNGKISEYHRVIKY